MLSPKRSQKWFKEKVVVRQTPKELYMRGEREMPENTHGVLDGANCGVGREETLGERLGVIDGESLG